MNGILRKKCFFIWVVQMPDNTLIPVNPEHLHGLGIISGQEISGTISDEPFIIKTSPQHVQELTLNTGATFIPTKNLVIEQ